MNSPEMKNKFKSQAKDEEIYIFVYGTLMRGKNNHNRYLSNAEFLGNAVAEGFALYDLGSFPGVIPDKNDKVKGEAYRIDLDTLKRIDMLEGEGSLYNRCRTSISIGNRVLDYVYIYVYNHSVSGRKRIRFEHQPWPGFIPEEYVWYASYGSNMLYVRFITYIKGGRCKFNGKLYPGCRDKTPPRDSCPVTIPYKMYFGNSGSSWGEGGVSFLNLNVSGNTLGRMYLITKEQFEDIHSQEGRSDIWYNKIVELDEYEGIKVKTFTNRSERPHCKPSDKYMEVVRMGIKETYPEMSDSSIMEYLNNCCEG